MKTDPLPQKQRRAIHGGAAPSRPIAVQAGVSSPAAFGPRARSRRGTLVGGLLGLLIVMALLMKWLVEHQVEVAAQRRAQEAIARAAAARCFELASPRAVDACQKAQEIEDRPEVRSTRRGSGQP